MIFQSEHIQAIIEGRKTQTRRLVKPGDFATHFILPDYDTGETTIQSVQNHERLKWFWGKDYAVQDGRGKPGVQWCRAKKHYPAEWTAEYIDELGWNPLRIRLLEIRQERVQDISEADARAEGYPPKVFTPDEALISTGGWWYRILWDRINTRKGTRWDDNPDVWALTFEVTR